MKKVLALLFILFAHLQAETFPEKITVELSTENQMHPFYIGKFHHQQSKFDENYVQYLEGVFRSDLTYSSKAKILPHEDECEKQLQQTFEEKAFSQSFWEKKASTFVIRPKILASVLRLEVFITHSSIVHTFKDIHLTGDNRRDRMAIHELHDLLLERLFGEKGIASTHILFTKTFPQKGIPREKWASEIWEMDYDGNNARRIISDGNYNLTPTYIPNLESNSRQFLFVSYLLGQPKIFLSSSKGEKGKLIIHLRGNQLLPAVSKKGDKIAFISDAAGRPDLFMQHFLPESGVIGKPIQLFSYPRAVNASPTFSPDGSKIAFVSDKDWTPRIYLLETDQSSNVEDVICITQKNRENTAPSWSPDGKKIAYSAKTNNTRQIWIYDFDTKEEKQITTGPGHKENPFFAPNSLHIVYNTTGDKMDLYMIDLNQKKPIKITKGPEMNHYPAWEPK